MKYPHGYGPQSGLFDVNIHVTLVKRNRLGEIKVMLKLYFIISMVEVYDHVLLIEAELILSFIVITKLNPTMKMTFFSISLHKVK